MDINSSSEDESGPSGDDDRMQQQGGAQSEQPAASDAVETLVISFNDGEPRISGSSHGAVISEARGNIAPSDGAEQGYLAMSVRGEVRRWRLTPPPCRATDANFLPAQAQTSTTKTKDRPTLRLEPGIPMADDMTISSWIHLPLPQSPFLYKDRGGPALRRRRHRWTTLYCDSEDEFNHVCILQFEDNMVRVRVRVRGGD